MSNKCDNKTTFCDAGSYCNNGECSPCDCDNGKTWDALSMYSWCRNAPFYGPKYCVCEKNNTMTTELLGVYKKEFCIPSRGRCEYGQWYDENEKKCKDCPCEDPGYINQPDNSSGASRETRKLCPGNNKKTVIPTQYCKPRCAVGQWYDQTENECKDCPCEDPGYEWHTITDDIRAACPGHGLKSNTIPAKDCTLPRCKVGRWYDQTENECKDCPCEDPGYKPDIKNQGVADACPGHGLTPNTIPTQYCKPRCKVGQWYDQTENECKDCPWEDPGYKPDIKNQGVADACPGHGLKSNTIPTKDCIPLCLPGYVINKKKYPNGWGPYDFNGVEPDDGCKLCTCESEQPSSSGGIYKLPTDPQKKKAVQNTCPGHSFTNSSGDANLIPDSTCELVDCSKQKTWPKTQRGPDGQVKKFCDTCLCNDGGSVVGWTTPTTDTLCPAKDSSCTYIGKYLVCDKDDCYPYDTRPNSSQISKDHSSCFFSTSGCENSLKKPSSSSYSDSTDDAYWDCDIRNEHGKKCKTLSTCYRLCSWKYPTGYSTSSNNLPSGNNNPPPYWD